MVKKKNIPQRIEDARLLIRGAMHMPVVSQEVAKYGYPMKELQRGEGLLNKVILLQSEKSSKYGLQFSASEQLKKDQATAWEQYLYHVKSAKLAFRNDIGKQKHLQLDVPRKRNLAGWMEQARYFYKEIQQMPESFAPMGVTAEEVAQTQAMIEAIGDTHRSCKGLQGEAQMATQERNLAMKALDEWVRRFTKTARLALDDQDQLLEGLGLLVRSKV
ncbi:hypothetical protein [Catalinimonas niigatensis]|uniref:hypothetical protein n=1 Tax=Catalinimonas niigatensis TaxID=1397264 RepID=UPI002665E462|nr:hypothetical protein [Catalinimonas niigatensis]WPP49061.1 hypothetical protein PZB72_20550 [Catalinimonas niigatensis]